MTCWRRLRDWQIAGVWDRLHQLLLTELRATGQLDLASAIVDSSHVRALKGGRQPDQAQSTGAAPAPSTMSSPTPPASHWLSSSRRHRNDVTQLIPLLDKIPPIRGRAGRPRRKPRMLVADRGYDHDTYRRLLRARGIRPMIARRGAAHRPRLGRRWRVERTIAWLHQYRRLRIRWERRVDIRLAFLAERVVDSVLYVLRIGVR